MTVYFNGEYKPKEEIRLSPDDRGFLFGDGVYEVICAYAGRQFKAAEHFQRLMRSMEELRMQPPDLNALSRVPETLLRENGLEQDWAVIYIQVTRGAAPRSHPFPDPQTPVTVYAYAAPFESPDQELEEGVRVVMTPDNRWLRCDIKSVNLLPNVLAAQTAREKGAKDVLFIRDGAVTEGSYTSFGAVFAGKVVTHPESHYILPGITRSAVLEICTKLSIPVERYPVQVARLQDADECMLWGTTTQVMPIVKVDDMTVGNGEPGPITRKLQTALRELILDSKQATP